MVLLMCLQSPTTVQAGLLYLSICIATTAPVRAVPALRPRAFQNPAQDTALLGAGRGLPVVVGVTRVGACACSTWQSYGCTESLAK